MSLRAQPPNTSIAVKSVRYWSTGQATRVAIELSEEAKYRTETLTEPDRFFVDVFDSRLEFGEKKFQTIKVGDSLVKQIRLAMNGPSTTRIVLDLTKKLQTEISQLSNPWRIVIEAREPGSRPAAPAVSQSRTGAERVEAASAKPLVPEPAEAKPAKPEIPYKLAEATPPQPTPKVVEEAPKPAPVTEAAGTPLAAAPKPAKPRAGGQQSLVRALGLKLGRVVIDAGHGGHDHGTTGPGGLTEKELVLDISRRLGTLIEEQLGSEVVYTRTTDVFIPLEERTAMANKQRADLFLSIHANSSPYKSISGAEVYYLNFTTSKEALDVAARENAGHGKSIFELSELVQKIALKDKVDESREFAAKVQSSLHTTWTRLNAKAKNRGVKKAPFVVLIGASMPSVLAEIGFLSNPKDESSLRRAETRQRLAEALFKGVQQYASTLSEMRVARGAEAASVESR